MSTALIRKARPSDAAHIIVAHVRSIRELCSKDYTPEQIKAWAGRDFSTENWIRRMVDSWLWVVEKDSFVEGVAFLRKETDEISFMDALYFTPAVTGLGLGKQMMKLVMQEARAQGFKSMKLEATLTSYKFYQKQGFVDDPSCKEKRIFGGVEIPCIAMKIDL